MNKIVSNIDNLSAIFNGNMVIISRALGENASAFNYRTASKANKNIVGEGVVVNLCYINIVSSCEVENVIVDEYV